MMNKAFLNLVFFCIAPFIQAQMKLILTAIPADTPTDAQIYMASSLNNWNPKDDAYLLKKDDSGQYQITLPPQNQKVEYKFTLGSWDRVEADAEGHQIPNRVLESTNGTAVVENTILSWQRAEEKKHSLSDQVKILSEHFSIPQLKTTRRIWIYLPDDYSVSKKSYPVIYMEDGQNLFDQATSFSGEWKVDETLDLLTKEGKPNAIIVGIDNGGPERLNEYSPWKNPKYGGGKGDLYADFIANTLKPYIDKSFRTLPQSKYTGLFGSSMGGLISFYIGLKYPQKFGNLGIFSPSFWFAESDLKHFLNRNSKSLKNSKFYFLAGSHESDDMVVDIESVVQVLIRKGVLKSNIKTKFDPNGTHSEKFWSEGFGEAFLWFYNR